MSLPNRYYEDWTAKLPDQAGKVVAITGTTSGTGYWAAVFCIRKNAKAVFLLNRSSKRSIDSLARLQKEKDHVNSQTELIAIDCNLQNFDSVKAAATEVVKRCEELGGLQVLMNNAGIMAHPDVRTGDGYDVQMQTNHFSHFILTKLLMPSFQISLDSDKEVRICQHSSSARHIMTKDFERKYFEKSKKGTLGGNSINAGMERYQQTKLSNLTFCLTLSEKLKEKGFDISKIKSVAAEPGYSRTGLADNTKNQKGFFTRMFIAFGLRIMLLLVSTQSAADGALPMIHASFGEDVDSGDFFIPKHRKIGVPLKTIAKGELTADGTMEEEKRALDKSNQEKCWQWTEEECGNFFE